MADWSTVDATALTRACLISVASATLATLLIALCGIPLGYLLARGVEPRHGPGRLSGSAAARFAAARQRHIAVVSGRLYDAARPPHLWRADRQLRRHRARRSLRRGAVSDHRRALGLRRDGSGAGRRRRDARARSARRVFSRQHADRAAGHPIRIVAGVAARLRRIRRHRDGRLSPLFAAGLHLRRVRLAGPAGDAAGFGADTGARRCHHGAEHARRPPRAGAAGRGIERDDAAGGGDGHRAATRVVEAR